ncbi:DNA replication/repair protein RecF [Candidatus Sumerlaeota bacterium]|nr:DNA replication/repair protein RecF [Candidatus Sumerlaeota bacterium]
MNGWPESGGCKIDMRLQSISIRNFRNLESLELEFSSGLNVIHGLNGQGKTNLLEAMFYLVTGRSFRTHQDGAVLPLGAAADAVAAIEGLVIRENGGRNRLRVAISRQGKRILIDEKPVAQLAGLWGRLRAVLFTPDDLMILKDGPALRRRMIDITLSQIDAGYLAALQNYSRALRQRNLLLRDAEERRAPRDQILAFNAPLAQWGAAIHEKRRRFLHDLGERAARLYAGIAPSSETLELEYRDALHGKKFSSPEAALTAWRKMMDGNIETDIRRGQTLRGAHREDMRLELSGRDLRQFGSQGQLRTAMLSLRLAELELMRDWSGEPAILMLDDLASELDAPRRNQLFTRLDAGLQTILTTIDPELLGSRLENARTIHLQDGRLISTD